MTLDEIVRLAKSTDAPWIIVHGAIGRPLVLERRKIGGIAKVARRLRATSSVDLERGALVLRLAWTRPGHCGGACLTHADRLVLPLPEPGMGLVRRPGERALKRALWVSL